MYKSPRLVPTSSTLESTPLREGRGERDRERVHIPFSHFSPPNCQVFSGGRGECGDRC